MVHSCPVLLYLAGYSHTVLPHLPPPPPASKPPASSSPHLHATSHYSPCTMHTCRERQSQTCPCHAPCPPVVVISQDFEALTPNLLARTIETVEGGGLVVLLLSNLSSLTQLYTLTMDVHARLRTDAHQTVTGERLWCRF